MRAYKLKKCKRVHGVHFAPDGKQLLAVGGGEVGLVERAVWLDLATGENAGGVEMYANCYAVNPALTRYALGGADGWGELQEGIAEVQWKAPGDAEAEWETFRLPSTKARQPFLEVIGLAFDATGTRLAIGHETRRPQRFELSVVTNGAVDQRVVIRTDEAAVHIAFNADSTRVAVTGGAVGGDTLASVYDLVSRERVFAFEPPATVTRCVQFLSDDRLVVANGRNVYIVPAVGGDPQFTLGGHKGQVNAIALAPDGRRVLSASHDGAIRTWDANTGEPGKAFDWGIGAVTALAFAPDGLTCAAAGLNGKVVVWDVDA